MVYIRYTYSLYVLYLAQKSCRSNNYAPFTSFLAIQVLDRVFSSTTLNLEQTYTNVILCTVYEIKPLFASTK
jgi:hypothetical protein